MIPALIDTETLEWVKNKMDRRKTSPQGRPKAKVTYLLTGQLRCGDCGAAFIGYGHCRGVYFYSCSKRKTKACMNPTILKN